jgi:hypothetical protein
VGLGFCRGKKSSILDEAQMYTHNHILIHEIDISNSHEAGY